MISSRCGILCEDCSYKEEVGCKGCLNIERPFWAGESNCPVKECVEKRNLNHCGECEIFPCKLANSFAYDEKQGDNGKRLKQCRAWCSNKN